MRVEIKYCGQWNYEPRARAAAKLIHKARPDAQVTLQRSGGGVFEIRVDDRVACSKQIIGRFPTDAEIIAALTWIATFLDRSGRDTSWHLIDQRYDPAEVAETGLPVPAALTTAIAASAIEGRDCQSSMDKRVDGRPRDRAKAS